jgi:hypothetical protein
LLLLLLLHTRAHSARIGDLEIVDTCFEGAFLEVDSSGPSTGFASIPNTELDVHVTRKVRLLAVVVKRSHGCATNVPLDVLRVPLDAVRLEFFGCVLHVCTVSYGITIVEDSVDKKVCLRRVDFLADPVV